MELMKHQKEANNLFNGKYSRKMILAWEMGSGKTVGSLYIMSKLNKKVVIVVPKSLKWQWKNEILKFNFASEDEIFLSENKKDLQYININKVKYIIVHYEELRVFEYLERLFKKCFDYKILNKYVKRNEIFSNIKSVQDILLLEDSIIDYEVLNYNNSIFKRNEELYIIDIFLKMKNNICLIIDELYKVKNYRSILHKSMKNFISILNINEIIGLDGTPFYNSVFETYNICNLIKKDVIKYNELQRFYYKGFYNNIIFRNLGEFNTILVNRIMNRVKKEDILDDLPQLFIKNYFVSNVEETERLKRTLINEVGNIFEIYTLLRVVDSYYNYDNLLKSNKREDITKLMFILERYGYNKEIINKEKVDTLLDIIEELSNNKIIIFSSFANTVVFLYNFLIDKGYKKVRYVCSSVNNKEEIVRSFLNTDEVNILLTTDVLSKGLNAVNIDYLINYDIAPSFALMMQRNSRIHRINSKNGKVVINLISNIIERDILGILERKRQNFNLVIDGGERDNYDTDILTSLAELWGITLNKKVVKN